MHMNPRRIPVVKSEIAKYEIWVEKCFVNKYLGDFSGAAAEFMGEFNSVEFGCVSVAGAIHFLRRSCANLWWCRQMEYPNISNEVR